MKLKEVATKNQAEGCSDLLTKVGNPDMSSDIQLDKKVYSNHVLLDCSSFKERKFSLQYAHSYFVRLKALENRLNEKIKEEWMIDDSKLCLKKIGDLCENSMSTSDQSSSSPGKKSSNKKKSGYQSHEQHVSFQQDITVAIIGTVFKQQPEKPSILQELCDENPMVPVTPKTSYISDQDFLLLEDAKSRVRLILASDCGITVHDVVNGIVCAVKGKPTIDGRFEVHDFIWATPRPAVWLNMDKFLDIEMVFVSGLLLGRPDSDKNDVFINLLFDYLTGLVGSIGEQTNKISRQTRVFFVGNSLWRNDNASSSASIDDNILTNAKKLDATLTALAKTMEVFIFPGKTDPGESMLPQPPIHRCIFPNASRLETFKSLSNPTRVKLDVTDTKDVKNHLDIIFSSGENVLDAMRNSNITCPLEMSRRLLQWGHICPTAPDTLPLHPGCQEDEFVIKDVLPHMFIVGNQKKFDVLDWGTTKIVTVPDFSQTGCAAVLTKDMEFMQLNFDASF